MIDLTHTPDITLWRKTAAIAITTALLLIIFIHSGINDPKPVGPLLWQQQLTPQTISSHPQQTWLTHPQLSNNYSVRLTAAYASGERDHQYGLLIGQPNHYLAITIAATGHLAITELHSKQTIHHRPFSTFPHIQLGTAVNEIWVDVTEQQINLRLNREWVWQGTWVGDNQIGIWAQSYGQTAVINWQQIQLYAEAE